MVTFLAGPAVNMRPPTREIAAKRSRNHPSGDHSQPYRDEPDRDTQDYIQSGHEQFSVLNASKCFVLECRKRGVGSDKSDRDQVPPVRAPVGSLGKNRNDEPDQERARAVDNKRTVRKSRSHAIADVSAEPKSSDRADKAANAHNQVLVHESRGSPFFRMTQRNLCPEIRTLALTPISFAGYLPGT